MLPACCAARRPPPVQKPKPKYDEKRVESPMVFFFSSAHCGAYRSPQRGPDAAEGRAQWAAMQ